MNCIAISNSPKVKGESLKCCWIRNFLSSPLLHTQLLSTNLSFIGDCDLKSSITARDNQKEIDAVLCNLRAVQYLL